MIDNRHVSIQGDLSAYFFNHFCGVITKRTAELCQFSYPVGSPSFGFWPHAHALIPRRNHAAHGATVTCTGKGSELAPLSSLTVSAKVSVAV